MPGLQFQVGRASSCENVNTRVVGGWHRLQLASGTVVVEKRPSRAFDDPPNLVELRAKINGNSPCQPLRRDSAGGSRES